MPAPNHSGEGIQADGQLNEKYQRPNGVGVGPDFHAERWEGGGNLEWGLTAHTEEKSVHIRVG